MCLCHYRSTVGNFLWGLPPRFLISKRGMCVGNRFSGKLRNHFLSYEITTRLGFLGTSVGTIGDPITIMTNSCGQVRVSKLKEALSFVAISLINL